LLAIWLLASTKKAPSAAELSRHLGVTAKTAWLVRRKITHAARMISFCVASSSSTRAFSAPERSWPTGLETVKPHYLSE
jgi:hypothetical protein